MTASQFASLVRGRKVGRGKFTGFCPSHPDRNRSLSIAEGKSGVLVRCMSQGCDTRDILDNLGLKFADIFYTARVIPDRAFLTDRAKLDDLKRKHLLMLWMASLEPEREHYWFAAMRRVAEEMEPLYWKVLPDKERIDELFAWEAEDYRRRRMDWLLEHGKSRVLLDGK